jgi:hypothetical protein
MERRIATAKDVMKINIQAYGSHRVVRACASDALRGLDQGKRRAEADTLGFVAVQEPRPAGILQRNRRSDERPIGTMPSG